MAIFRDAVEPSKPAKIVLVSVSVAAAFLTAGIVFGYSGLYKVLAVDEGIYASTCLEGESRPCDGQSRLLTAAYTIAAATISGSGIFIGLLLDAVGPRWTICAGSVTFAAGLVAMIYIKMVSDHLVFVGFFLLSLGGPAIFNAMLNFGELFPLQSATIIAAQNGMFDASAVVLFMMAKVIEAGIPLAAIMSAYLVVPVVILVVALFLVPDRPYGGESGEGQQGGELWRVYHIRKKLSAASIVEPVTQPLLSDDQLKEPDEIYNTSIVKQLSSLVFWLQTAVTGYFILRSNFYIASVYSQLSFIIIRQSGGAPVDLVTATQQYLDIFNYLLPICGFAMVPVAGYIMTELGMSTSFFCVGLMTALSTTTQLMYFLPVQFQIISFVLYALVRPFIFGATAAFLGRVFGFSNFGRLFGVNRLGGALFTALQYPLTSLAERTFGGNYFFVNLGFLCTELFIMIAFPLYLWKVVFYGFLIRPKLAAGQPAPEAPPLPEVTAEDAKPKLTEDGKVVGGGWNYMMSGGSS
eukprot:TRINITY_DN32732_c0_g1_i1.p1 TRINITY_DN32732_c0_g1~~TRINITY_DN32732_c0_g1_i1.p1  ORF type:complete len:522 (-),score=105.28 TRINITY_DN32732_c0_g1_i1:567-2132(-)